MLRHLHARTESTAYIFVDIALLILLAIAVTGCGVAPAFNPVRYQQDPVKPTTPVLVDQVKQDLGILHTHVDAAHASAAKIDATNWGQQRGEVILHLNDAQIDLSRLDLRLADTKSAAVADAGQKQELVRVAAKQAEQIQDLKRDDPVRRWLLIAGLGLTLGGIALLVAGFFYATLALLRGWSVIAILTGCVAATLAHFLGVIYIVLGGTLAVVFLGVLIYLIVRLVKKDSAGRSTIQVLEQAKLSGVIPPEIWAKLRPMLEAGQTDEAVRMVKAETT